MNMGWAQIPSCSSVSNPALLPQSDEEKTVYEEFPETVDVLKTKCLFVPKFAARSKATVLFSESNSTTFSSFYY